MWALDFVGVDRCGTSGSLDNGELFLQGVQGSGSFFVTARSLLREHGLPELQRLYLPFRHLLCFGAAFGGFSAGAGGVFPSGLLLRGFDLFNLLFDLLGVTDELVCVLELAQTIRRTIKFLALLHEDLLADFLVPLEGGLSEAPAAVLTLDQRPWRRPLVVRTRRNAAVVHRPLAWWHLLRRGRATRGAVAAEIQIPAAAAETLHATKAVAAEAFSAKTPAKAPAEAAAAALSRSSRRRSLPPICGVPLRARRGTTTPATTTFPALQKSGLNYSGAWASA
mmetsp:Transcript_117582/g.332648  ORF Transcript_117582/g.332648 Transcript_117582/m.332648 type:complete len:280 (-) Transcript_117582:2-841(-)